MRFPFHASTRGRLLESRQPSPSHMISPSPSSLNGTRPAVRDTTRPPALEQTIEVWFQQLAVANPPLTNCRSAAFEMHDRRCPLHIADLAYSSVGSGGLVCGVGGARSPSFCVLQVTRTSQGHAACSSSSSLRKGLTVALCSPQPSGFHFLRRGGGTEADPMSLQAETFLSPYDEDHRPGHNLSFGSLDVETMRACKRHKSIR